MHLSSPFLSRPHLATAALALWIIGSLAHNAQAACYAVYNGAGQLQYRSDTSPVDMAQPLDEQLQARFGQGAALIVDSSDGFCDSHGVVSTAAPFQWRNQERPKIEIGADSWPATEGSVVHYHGFGPGRGAYFVGPAHSHWSGYRGGYWGGYRGGNHSHGGNGGNGHRR